MSSDSGRISYSIQIEILVYLQTFHARFRKNTLTNTELRWFGSLTTGTVADDTAVAPFIGLLHTRDGYCGTVSSWKAFQITRLPLLCPMSLSSRIPLPFVAQRFCSSGFSTERCTSAWSNVLQLLGMCSDSGGISCMYNTTN